jgi:Tfp pilus assembly protein PilO
MKMFSPFKFEDDKASAGSEAGATASTDVAELRRLQQELEEMQRRLGEISRKQPTDK